MACVICDSSERVAALLKDLVDHEGGADHTADVLMGILSERADELRCSFCQCGHAAGDHGFEGPHSCARCECHVLLVIGLTEVQRDLREVEARWR
jgi:hypothetical protein